MADSILFTDLQLLVYRFGKQINSWVCPSPEALRRMVAKLSNDFESSLDEIMEHLEQFGSHDEGDISLMTPDMEMVDEQAHPVPWPQQKGAPAVNHYLVTGRLDGGEDMTKYVIAPMVTEAEDKFKKHINPDTTVEVFISMVVQLDSPPVAIYTEEGVEENPEPIQ